MSRREQPPQESSTSDQVIENILKDIQDVKKDIKRMKKRLSEQDQKINVLEKIVHLSRDKRNAEIKEKEMSLQDPYLQIYQSVLYNKLNDNFDSHRIISTGLVTRDLSGKIEAGEKVVRTISSLVKHATQDIPVVKYFTKGADYLINKGYDEENKKESVEETNAICVYLSDNKDVFGHLEEDVGLNCKAASVELASRNSTNLLSIIKSKNFDFFSKNPFRKNLRIHVSKLFKDLISRYPSEKAKRACILACEDAMLVMVEISLGWEKLIASEDSMEDQLINLVMKHY